MRFNFHKHPLEPVPPLRKKQEVKSSQDWMMLVVAMIAFWSSLAFDIAWYYRLFLAAIAGFILVMGPRRGGSNG